MLGKLRSPRTVPALVEATRWVPDYLDFDDNRALATAWRSVSVIAKYRTCRVGAPDSGQWARTASS
ncbi:hypothetical protein E2C00_18095 [Streptomyces sp. WAC05374]|uniref:hypothetical protein n=1 Tax=Streptomyces sp. WAC05374 TaxID=2487420 RepID=UPI000F865558|nr:hypothetical protein [Streptomyces sp. WAC05374]RST14149.1 hypothetical protein EF905_18250 [Streptomyces sp. WAC05374]TDF54793.1 hypothetical protein E2C00_18095 [Streptomyces sp. WAC05374]TDF56429.1 hypothetical protein E2C02_13550 [Streptomyces sp. WAC05374]